MHRLALTNQAIKRTKRRIQATAYCLDLARWANNQPAVERHLIALDETRAELKTLELSLKNK